jgi:hypothetical protein
MTRYNTRSLLFFSLLLILLSLGAILINRSIYDFPGNNYFPSDAFPVGLSLCLIYSGCGLYFGPNGLLTQSFKEIIYFFLVMSLIALATNAAQYTPFPRVDKYLISIEKALHIDIKSIVLWTHSKPNFKNLLELIYDSLPYQMAYLPLLMIARKQSSCLHEYYFLLVVSTIAGFTFYYFFPTTAPASMIESHCFSLAQKATALKFTQIHHHIQPSTIEGGMIAFPSFHVIWGWFCLYLIRGYPLFVMVMLPINTLLMASCVLLGWHYVIDLFGSIVVILLSHSVYLACKQTESVSPPPLPISDGVTVSCGDG